MCSSDLDSLSEQSVEVAAAIQNLEIMEDFQTEVASHVKSLETLRRTLVDIAMMESTVGRVAQMIAPLSEIGNLRRLSETEVRDAARIILDRRSTRISQTGETAPQVSGTEFGTTTESDLVPLPPEARN